jgi:hypothetical protein
VKFKSGSTTLILLLQLFLQVWGCWYKVAAGVIYCSLFKSGSTILILYAALLLLYFCKLLIWKMILNIDKFLPNFVLVSQLHLRVHRCWQVGHGRELAVVGRVHEAFSGSWMPVTSWTPASSPSIGIT